MNLETLIIELKKEYKNLAENEKIVPMKVIDNFLSKKDLKENEYIELKDKIIEIAGKSDIFWAYSQLEISKKDFKNLIQELENERNKI